MKTFIMYDIKDNKIRNKLIKFLRNLGFLRIQKSVFLGDISNNIFNILEYNISKIINIHFDSIYIFSISENEYKKCIFMDKRKIQLILEANALIL